MTCRTFRRIAFTMLVVLLPMTAGAPPPQPSCVTPDGTPIRRHRRSTLICRDGDPRCDLDRQCDGICVLEYCFDFSKECRPPRPSFCPGSDSPWDLGSQRTGKQWRTTANTDDFIDTKLIMRCRRGRPGCTRRTSSCTATVTGGTTGTSQRCWATAMRLSFGPPVLDIIVDAPRLSIAGRMELTRTDAGQYVLGDGIHYLDMGLTTPDGSFGAFGADYAPADVRGSVQVELSAPLPEAVYSEPHGTFTATFVSNSGAAPADVQIAF